MPYDDKEKGLYTKFNVSRTDPSAQSRHKDCFCFVLDTAHDPLSVPALFAYANAAGKEGYYKLAGDLFALLIKMPASGLRVEQVMARADRLTEDTLDPNHRRLVKLRSITDEFAHLMHAYLMSLSRDGGFDHIDFDEPAIVDHLLETIEMTSIATMGGNVGMKIDHPEIELAATAMLVWLQRRVLHPVSQDGPIKGDDPLKIEVTVHCVDGEDDRSDPHPSGFWAREDSDDEWRMLGNTADLSDFDIRFVVWLQPDETLRGRRDAMAQKDDWVKRGASVTIDFKDHPEKTEEPTTIQ